MKDPRKILKFIFKLSLVIIVLVPAVLYLISVHLPASYSIKFFSYVIVAIVGVFLIKKFYKKSEEKELSDVIPVGYMFASTYTFVCLLMLVFGIHTYIKDSEIPPP